MVAELRELGDARPADTHGSAAGRPARSPRGLRSARLSLGAALLCAIVSLAPEAPRAQPAHGGYLLLEPPLPPPPRGMSFAESKRRLHAEVFPGPDRREVYCGCRYGEDRSIDLSDCTSGGQYTPSGRHAARASHLEWEHALPASWVGHTFACWEAEEARDPRAYCRSTEPAFERAEGDMHVLFPSIGQVNALRENFAYGMVPGEEHPFGCDFEVGGRVAEPRPAVRGELARAVLYGAATYRVPLRPEVLRALRRFHQDDPPDAAERARNGRIQALQGNRNPYIDGRGTFRTRPAPPPPRNRVEPEGEGR